MIESKGKEGGEVRNFRVARIMGEGILRGPLLKYCWQRHPKKITGDQLYSKKVFLVNCMTHHVKLSLVNEQGCCSFVTLKLMQHQKRDNQLFDF